MKTSLENLELIEDGVLTIQLIFYCRSHIEEPTILQTLNKAAIFRKLIALLIQIWD